MGRDVTTGAVVAVVTACVLLGCKTKSSTSGDQAPGGATAAGSGADGGVSRDGGVVADGRVPEAAAHAVTDYVVKLRALPAAIRAAKKPPAKCPADAIAAAATTPPLAVALQSLDQLAGIEVNWNLDPGFFQLQLESQDTSYFRDISELERGRRQDMPAALREPDRLMRPLLVVTRPTKLEIAQVDQGSQFWPGSYVGMVYVVDAASARVLCGASLAFRSSSKVELVKTGLKFKGGSTTWIDSDDPKTKIEADFATRGRNALTAALAKIAPGLKIYGLRT